jgi:2-(1,2-epoxy-1,2-dihydrophenyl)acetyl-CoA isomerase
VEYEQITTEHRDDVLLITLDRPERLNAWTPQMSGELTDAIERADQDDDVGAVVITGAGRGVCAGADIEATFGAQLDGDAQAARPTRTRDWIDLVRSTKPIVVAINGVAVGVGLTMVLPCDRLIASTEARFSLRFVKMGLVPELASSHFLPNRVGFGPASDLMLSGRIIDAPAAHAMGLVDEVVEPERLVETAIERAREYGENPTPQLRWIKELLTMNAAESDLGAVQRREIEYLQRAYASPEHADAVRRFLEQRKS